MQTYTRAAAVINLENIAQNAKNIRKMVDGKAKIMAVVKADGYGHGAVAVSRTALVNGADWLGVATIHEGIALREAAIAAPILILSPAFEEEFEFAIVHKISLTVFELDTAEKISRVAKRLGKTADIHIKIDTGMARIGFLPRAEDCETIMDISRLPHIEISGIYSHLATSDSENKQFCYEQFGRFKHIIKMLEEKGLHIPLKYISNSGAILSLREFDCDMVRAGIILYGLPPDSTEEGAEELAKMGFRPCMELKSRVAYIKSVLKGESVGYGRNYYAERDIVVATVPIGYADGFSRLMSNSGRVLIHGQFANIIGNVCMDQFMVDITDIMNIENVHIHDEVVLMGQCGDKEITAEEMADLQKTINYEIVTSISGRVTKIYI